MITSHMYKYFEDLTFLAIDYFLLKMMISEMKIIVYRLIQNI